MSEKIQLVQQLLWGCQFAGRMNDLEFDNDRSHINIVGRQKHAQQRDKKNKIAKQSRRRNRR